MFKGKSPSPWTMLAFDLNIQWHTSVSKAQPDTIHRNSSITMCWQSGPARPRWLFNAITTKCQLIKISYYFTWSWTFKTSTSMQYECIHMVTCLLNICLSQMLFAQRLAFEVYFMTDVKWSVVNGREVKAFHRNNLEDTVNKFQIIWQYVSCYRSISIQWYCSFVPLLWGLMIPFQTSRCHQFIHEFIYFLFSLYLILKMIPITPWKLFVCHKSPLSKLCHDIYCVEYL